MERFPNFSREFIKKKISKKEILIEGRDAKTKPSTKVKTWERIHVYTYKSNLEDEYWRGEKIDFNKAQILFEDDDLYIISKPAFMSTHPAGKHLFHCATVFLEKHYGNQVYSIHRLDRETSGVLLVGKNVPITNNLSNAFEDKLVSKCYFFMAHKKKNKTFPFTAKERLAAEEVRLFVNCYPEDSTQGKVSETYFDKLFENDNYILGLAFPKTGRQHQIRTHAAFHGLPLVGDKIYLGGSDMFSRFKDNEATEHDFSSMQIPRHALHALALAFPYKGDKKLIIDEFPKDLEVWIENNIKEVDLKDLHQMLELKIENYFKEFKKL